MEVYNSKHPSRRDDEFGKHVEQMILNSIGVANHMKSFSDQLYQKPSKKIHLEDFDLITHPCSYQDSKVIVYYFFDGIDFEEMEEDFFILKELITFLKSEKYFKNPEKAMLLESFNWNQYIELFLNWRGY